MPRRLLSLPLVAVAIALVSGCGGSDSTATRPVDEWASAYCVDATEWLTLLVDARDGVKGKVVLPKDAVGIMTIRTNQFVTALGDLGEPETPDGSASASTANGLAKTVEGHASDASQATLREQIDESLAAMKDTTASLARRDVTLGNAMEAAGDCAILQDEMRKHL